MLACALPPKATSTLKWGSAQRKRPAARIPVGGESVACPAVSVAQNTQVYLGLSRPTGPWYSPTPALCHLLSHEACFGIFCSMVVPRFKYLPRGSRHSRKWKVEGQLETRKGPKTPCSLLGGYLGPMDSMEKHLYPWEMASMQGDTPGCCQCSKRRKAHYRMLPLS